MVSLSAVYALYQVSVRQATISLSLLLAHTSRCKPWESLWGSSATTPLVDFHHRLTACPSYHKNGTAICDPSDISFYDLNKLLSVFLRLINSFSDIVPHILVLEVYPLCRGISILSRFFQIFSFCRHAEDTTAVCHDLSVLEFCSGMEAVIAVMLLELVKAFDRKPLSYFTG